MLHSINLPLKEEICRKILILKGCISQVSGLLMPLSVLNSYRNVNVELFWAWAHWNGRYRKRSVQHSPEALEEEIAKKNINKRKNPLERNVFKRLVTYFLKNHFLSKNVLWFFVSLLLLRGWTSLGLGSKARTKFWARRKYEPNFRAAWSVFKLKDSNSQKIKGLNQVRD